MSHSVDNTPGAKGVCQRCGFKYHLRDLRKEWTAARVCPECWDRKPEALKPFPKIRPEGLPKKNASPEPETRYVAIGELSKDDL